MTFQKEDAEYFDDKEEYMDELMREKEENERDFQRTWLYLGRDKDDYSPYERTLPPLDEPDDLDWDRS